MPQFTNTILASFVLLALCRCGSSSQDFAGGYPYPNRLTKDDSSMYYFPIKDSLSRLDSFRLSFDHVFFKGFDEPNLSIAPMTNPVYRFHIDGWKLKPVIITLSNQKLIVKQMTVDNRMDFMDTSRVIGIERVHLNLLHREFPIDTTGRAAHVRKYLDSMTGSFPQLLDPKYYKYLLDKEMIPNKNRFHYSIKEINLTAEQYTKLVDRINSSGYWQLPYELKCESSDMDGFVFALEANTPRKYKIVRAYSCSDHTAFSKLCSEFIKIAGLDLPVK